LARAFGRNADQGHTGLEGPDVAVSYPPPTRDLARVGHDPSVQRDNGQQRSTALLMCGISVDRSLLQMALVASAKEIGCARVTPATAKASAASSTNTSRGNRNSQSDNGCTQRDTSSSGSPPVMRVKATVATSAPSAG
jgi:hypothetical protein